MTTYTRDDLRLLARRALDKFGANVQMRRFAEECAESIQAVLKYQDNRGVRRVDVAEELVGVLITAAQVELWLANTIGTDALNGVWQQQLAKLAKAIEEGR